jgi:hypothetical protein
LKSRQIFVYSGKTALPKKDKKAFPKKVIFHQKVPNKSVEALSIKNKPAKTGKNGVQTG